MTKKIINKGAQIAKTFLFRLLTYQAGGFLKKPLAIFTLLHKAIAKVDKYDNTSSLLKDFSRNLRLLFEVVKESISGSYKGFSVKNLVLMIAAILYFVSPLDIIPDFLPFLGILDDVSLIAWVISNLTTEIDEFEQWKKQQTLVEGGLAASPTSLNSPMPPPLPLDAQDIPDSFDENKK